MSHDAEQDVADDAGAGLLGDDGDGGVVAVEQSGDQVGFGGGGKGGAVEGVDGGAVGVAGVADDDQGGGGGAAGRRCQTQQVGAAGAGEVVGGFGTPGADVGVMAVHENGGNVAAFPDGGAGVVGVVQQVPGAGAEAVFVGAGGVAQGARKQADDGVNKNHGGQFAAGEDEVAQADLLQAAAGFIFLEGIEDALVEAFVVAAEQKQAFGFGEVGAEGLGEGLAFGGGERCGAGGRGAERPRV